MKTIGDTIIGIGNQITIICYTIKYWLRGEDWVDAKVTAINIVDAGWR